jgi:hypothetical protein
VAALLALLTLKLLLSARTRAAAVRSAKGGLELALLGATVAMIARSIVVSAGVQEPRVKFEMDADTEHPPSLVERVTDKFGSIFRSRAGGHALTIGLVILWVSRQMKRR